MRQAAELPLLCLPNNAKGMDSKDFEFLVVKTALFLKYGSPQQLSAFRGLGSLLGFENCWTAPELTHSVADASVRLVRIARETARTSGRIGARSRYA